MNTCLITKLKSVVDNDNLEKFNEIKLVVPPREKECAININVITENITRIYSKNSLVKFKKYGDENYSSDIYVNSTSGSMPIVYLVKNLSDTNQPFFITEKQNIWSFGQTASSEEYPGLAYTSESDKIYIKDMLNLSSVIASVGFDTNHLIVGELSDFNACVRDYNYIWCDRLTGTFEKYVEKFASTINNVKFGYSCPYVTLNGVLTYLIGNDNMAPATGWSFDNGVFTIKMRGLENAATYNPAAPVGSQWTYNFNN